MAQTKTLRLILGDQLNIKHSWFTKVDSNVTYTLMEVKPESEYVTHHVQKILMFFEAMRQFAAQLTLLGHHVVYFKIDDINNKHSFQENLQALVQQDGYTHFEYQLPDEYRLDALLKGVSATLGLATKVYDTEHFLTSREELAAFFKGKKTYLMENFYRNMRKKYGLLMQNDQPEGGRWNFDAENRKKLPKEHVVTPPKRFSHNLTALLADVNNAGLSHFGKVRANDVVWPANRQEALELMQFFNAECLPLFGHFQDAMVTNQWSLYHSRLSFALNVKLISPLEVCESAIAEMRKRPSEITLPQVEGFVRQIIGWREYMRGVYWAQMPNYSGLNYFDHQRSLPKMYWTGETKMKCMSQAISQSLEHAYAHHIQRLMITGNFALLMETHPDEVDQWYLGVYIDAIEWVEITNTRGMSQFADGGIVATKPYVSSAAYIDKMSNYCAGCFYDKKQKVGAKACPFNSLYWHFMDQHQPLLNKNPRIGMIYKTWEKMSAQARGEILEQANHYLNQRDTI